MLDVLPVSFPSQVSRLAPNMLKNFSISGTYLGLLTLRSPLGADDNEKGHPLGWPFPILVELEA